jgi:uncharacterized protein (TIGR00299 family) protein
LELIAVARIHTLRWTPCATCYDRIEGDGVSHLHFDCFSGISGDMVLGAFVDAGLPLKDLVRALKAVPIGGYRFRSSKVMRGGLHATKVDVLVERGFRSPFSLSRIHRIIRSSRLSPAIKELAHAVFDRLAQAEGLAHRVAASNVRFHEVGVIDSFVDVVGALLGCHLLGVSRITASSVNLGSGLIDSSHGTLPAPGPAVAAMTRGVPVYSTGPRRELTTPTGMALLTTLTHEFGSLPLMRPTSIGLGAGDADVPGWPNVLRVFLGDSASDGAGESDRVVQIETNLDDLNPQAYETTLERLFSAGALDVTLMPVIMKHGRPGIVLTALASPEKAQAVADRVLQETSTLGVRIQDLARRVLPRRTVEVRTKDGLIRVKVADLGSGRSKAAPEYQDCKRIAEQTGRPLRDIMDEAALAYRLAAQGKSKKAKGKSKNAK